MKDMIWKLKVLRLMLLSEVEIWKKEVWDKDPDSTFCCDGRECHCAGATVAEIYNIDAHSKPTDFSK